MSDKQLVESLRALAHKDSVVYDVLLYFSTRQRSQRAGRVYVNALRDSMSVEGFKHAGDEYARVLRAFSETFHLGVTMRNAKGKVLGIQKVTMSLPSLGKAVLAEGALRNSKSRNRYQKLEAPKAVAAPVSREQRNPRPWQTPSSNVVVTFLINGKAFNLTVPQGTTPMEIGELVYKLQDHEVKQ